MIFHFTYSAYQFNANKKKLCMIFVITFLGTTLKLLKIPILLVSKLLSIERLSFFQKASLSSKGINIKHMVLLLGAHWLPLTQSRSFCSPGLCIWCQSILPLTRSTTLQNPPTRSKEKKNVGTLHAFDLFQRFLPPPPAKGLFHAISSHIYLTPSATLFHRYYFKIKYVRSKVFQNCAFHLHHRFMI